MHFVININYKAAIFELINNIEYEIMISRIENVEIYELFYMV